MNELQEKVLTVIEAGAYIGLAKNTCYNLVSQGKFPFRIIDLCGRKRVRMSDILATIAAAEVISTPAQPFNAADLAVNHHRLLESIGYRFLG